MDKKHLFLIGFAGAGKTMIGQLLKKPLSLPLIDTDNLFIEKHGAINKYFALYGEAAFRTTETSLLREIVCGPNSIISTGGGTVLAEANRDLMKECGLVVALHAELREIQSRLLNDPGERPLLGNPVSMHKLTQLHIARARIYDFAHLRVNTSGKMLTEIVKIISSFWQGVKEVERGQQ